MKDRSDNPLYHEQILLPQSYISPQFYIEVEIFLTKDYIMYASVILKRMRHNSMVEHMLMV